MPRSVKQILQRSLELHVWRAHANEHRCPGYVAPYGVMRNRRQEEIASTSRQTSGPLHTLAERSMKPILLYICLHNYVARSLFRPGACAKLRIQGHGA